MSFLAILFEHFETWVVCGDVVFPCVDRPLVFTSVCNNMRPLRNLYQSCVQSPFCFHHLLCICIVLIVH